MFNQQPRNKKQSNQPLGGGGIFFRPDPWGKFDEHIKHIFQIGGENHQLESLQTMQIRHGDPSDHTPFGLLNLVFRGLTLGTFSLSDNKKMKSFEKNRSSEAFFLVCFFMFFHVFLGVVNLQKKHVSNHIF